MKSYLLIYHNHQHNIIHGVTGFPFSVASFRTTKEWAKIIKAWSQYPDDCIVAEMSPESAKGPQTGYNTLVSFKSSLAQWEKENKP